MKVSKNPHLWFCLFIGLLSLCCLIYFDCRKTGFHVDEIYSYGLSNSEYCSFISYGERDYTVRDWMHDYGTGSNPVEFFRNLVSDFKILNANDFKLKSTTIYADYLRASANNHITNQQSTWVDGSVYRDYLTATEDSRFNFVSVYYNQRGDVHPPLYYMLLHLVCSFFPGVFTKWLGLGLNLIIMALSLVAFYRLVCKVFTDRRQSDLAFALYALSTGFMSTGLYIRMYCLSALFAILLLSMHFTMLKTGHLGNVKGKLIAVTLAGYLTHYYFVLYVALIAIYTVIFFLRKKNPKDALRYALSYLIAAIIGLILWPFSVKHVFSGSLGFAGVDTSVFYPFDQLYLYICTLARNFLCGCVPLLYVFLALTLVLIVLWILHKKGEHLERLLFLLLPALLYTILDAKLAGHAYGRYIMNIFPAFAILLIMVLTYLLRECCTLIGNLKRRPLSRKLETALISLLGILMVLLACPLWRNPEYTIGGTQDTVTIAKGCDCVFVLPDYDWNESSYELTILKDCNRIGLVYESTIWNLSDTYTGTEEAPLCIAFLNGMDEDSIIAEVAEALGLSDVTVTACQSDNIATYVLVDYARP